MAHNNLGVSYKNQGQWDDAITWYKKAIRLKPDYARAYNNLALLYKKMGREDEAEKLMERAARIRAKQ